MMPIKKIITDKELREVWWKVKFLHKFKEFERKDIS